MHDFGKKSFWKNWLHHPKFTFFLFLLLQPTATYPVSRKLYELVWQTSRKKLMALFAWQLGTSPCPPPHITLLPASLSPRWFPQPYIWELFLVPHSPFCPCVHVCDGLTWHWRAAILCRLHSVLRECTLLRKAVRNYSTFSGLGFQQLWLEILPGGSFLSLKGGM